MPGAPALKIVADDETGELERIAILQTFGDVPDDVADWLEGGERVDRRITLSGLRMAA